MKLLDVNHLTVKYGNLTVVNDISFSLEEGQWLMLVGPNGAGKSTIVNAISQGVSYHGEISYSRKNIKKYKPNVLARHIGILSQNHSVGYSFTVGEIVRLGRYAHKQGFFSSGREEDEELVQQAMEMTGIAELEQQSVLTLSGGELQRTFLAQLFAQNPHVLILDEPTNHLDLIYQKQIFALVQEWLKTSGRAVISVVHDLSLAKAYGTHALLMNKANTVAYGSVQEVFSPEYLNRAYNMDVQSWMTHMLQQWQPQEEGSDENIV